MLDILQCKKKEKLSFYLLIMRKRLLIIFICFTHCIHSQPINYNNINIQLLDDNIINEVNNQRSKLGRTTINYSAVIHENVSKNITRNLVNKQKVYHPFSDKLYEKILIPLKFECIEKHDYVIKEISSETEVCIMIPIAFAKSKNIKTYQELGALFANVWKSSSAHRAILFGYGEKSKFLLGAVSIQLGNYKGYKSIYGSFQLLRPILN